MSPNFDVFELTKDFADDEVRFNLLLNFMKTIYKNCKEEVRNKTTKTFITKFLEHYSGEGSKYRSDPRLLEAWHLLGKTSTTLGYENVMKKLDSLAYFKMCPEFYRLWAENCVAKKDRRTFDDLYYRVGRLFKDNDDVLLIFDELLRKFGPRLAAPRDDLDATAFFFEKLGSSQQAAGDFYPHQSRANLSVVEEETEGNTSSTSITSSHGSNVSTVAADASYEAGSTKSQENNNHTFLIQLSPTSNDSGSTSIKTGTPTSTVVKDSASTSFGTPTSSSSAVKDSISINVGTPTTSSAVKESTSFNLGTPTSSSAAFKNSTSINVGTPTTSSAVKESTSTEKTPEAAALPAGYCSFTNHADDTLGETLSFSQETMREFSSPLLLTAIEELSVCVEKEDELMGPVPAAPSTSHQDVTCDSTPILKKAGRRRDSSDEDSDCDDPFGDILLPKPVKNLFEESEDATLAGLNTQSTTRAVSTPNHDKPSTVPTFEVSPTATFPLAGSSEAVKEEKKPFTFAPTK